jgi:hypothetical protein
MEPSFLGAPYGACLAALGFGLGDSIFNTQTYRLLGTERLFSWFIFTLMFYLFDSIQSILTSLCQLFSERIVGAFTLFQLFQNIGSAVGFYYAIGIPLLGPNSSYTQIYIQSVVLSIAVLLAFIGKLYNLAFSNSPRTTN